MDITFISDTHNKNAFFSHYLKKGGDIIVCCGDVTNKGEEPELKRFITWYDQLPFTHKILIAGNHDFIFEQSYTTAKRLLKDKHIIYLQDAAIVIDNIKFYGSPVTPYYYNWAFNKQRGAEIKKYWDKIPADTDILITHGPPQGILDKTAKGVRVGCEELLKAVSRIKPQIHAFGHIHESHGKVKKDGTEFINASLLNDSYLPIYRPVTITIPAVEKDNIK